MVAGMRTVRRHLLACLPVALAPAAARAFRLEAPTAEVAAEYQAACPAPMAHDALLAEVQQRLDGRPLPADALPRLQALARCPFCGCGVAGAPDHGEAAPPPRG
jgi:hypothetical protein